MKNFEQLSDTYFGAANGYNGFRSNFDNIFSAEALDKLFVIKGGPGTGKSTLMKKIRDRYTRRADVTTILCSSDPNSLDGLLIKSGGITVGVVDGTAPHTVEAKYPGVTEEIINLGDGFDFPKLRSHRNEILSLSKSKKAHYNSAYNSLNMAGKIIGYIKDEFLKSSHYKKAESYITNVFKGEQNEKYEVEKSPFLLSSFSKNGYDLIKNLSSDKMKISISGNGVSELIFTSLIYDIITKMMISASVFFSAFSNDIPDLIHTSSDLFLIDNSVDASINSEEFITGILGYDELKTAYISMLDSAKMHLAGASDEHFKMEDIYSNSISFEKNEDKYYHTIEEIDSLFYK